jgi:hypothetical protein
MSLKLAVPTDSPETPWIRSSERSTFTQCPQKWEWAYVNRWKPNISSPALRFGNLVHASLERFYRPGLKRGPKPGTTFQKLYAKELEFAETMGFRDEDGTWHDAGEMGTLMMEAYYERWGKDDRWEVLATEMPFHTPVYGEDGQLLFVYVGVLDGLWRNRGTKELWVVDHKTTRDDPTSKGEALILDEQCGAYWTYGVDYLRAMGLLKDDKKLMGMMYNFLRKGKPDERAKNSVGQSLNLDGTVSKRQPTPLFHREPVYRDELDGQMVRRRVMSQFDVMTLMREGTLSVYKVPGTLHNPHCKWCDFKDMCEIHEQQGDWDLVRRATTQTWDPYKQHEIEEAEKAA